ncbi:MAG: DNRLRE domain-containing protein [Bacteroidota bacterium]
MKFSFCVLLPVLILFSLSCSNQSSNPEDQEWGSLSVELSDTTPLKALQDSALTFDDASEIVITITHQSGEPTTFNSRRISFLKLGEEYMSEQIQLPVGDYKLDEFYLIDEESNVLFASPKAGSELSQHVEHPLSLDFSISANQTTSVNIQVISTRFFDAEDFGISSFTFTEVTLFNFLLSVTDALNNSVHADLVISNPSGDYTYRTTVEDEVARITVRDEYDSLRVTLSSDQPLPISHDYLYATSDLKMYTNTPLKIAIEPVQGDVFIQPAPQTGKDAELISSSRYENSNYGTVPNMRAESSTAGGIPFITRTLFDVDFPPNQCQSAPDSVFLYLQSRNEPTVGIAHRTSSGPNNAKFFIISEPWDEHTVTWNSQPDTLTSVYGGIPTSISGTQNYKIDFTEAFNNRFFESNPTDRYGFLMKLENEDGFRRLTFHSSDSDEPSKRPAWVLFGGDC